MSQESWGQEVHRDKEHEAGFENLGLYGKSSTVCVTRVHSPPNGGNMHQTTLGVPTCV